MDEGYIYCKETPKLESNMILYLHLIGELVQLEELIEKISKYLSKAKKQKNKGN